MKIASALRQAGAAVEVHDDHFQPDAKDQDWLAAVGARGWVVITKDQRIRYRSLEINALRNARVGAFILTGGNLRGDEIAQLLVNRLPAMKRFVAKHQVPFIAVVGKSGITPIRLSTDR